jgi:glycosyltransferase involved in cell wall biosynthesis
LLPYQPRSQLRYSLAAGHGLLVTLGEGLAGLSVPSKAYAIMAAGRPILFVGDSRSEIAGIIEANACGAVVGSGDAVRLANVIEDWAADGNKLDRMGRAARALFDSRFDRRHAVESYLQSFEKCMSATKAHDGVTREAKADREAEANL